MGFGVGVLGSSVDANQIARNQIESLERERADHLRTLRERDVQTRQERSQREQEAQLSDEELTRRQQMLARAEQTALDLQQELTVARQANRRATRRRDRLAWIFSIGLVVVSGMSIGTLFTLFVLPAVYVAIATDHRAAAESERSKEIADFDLGPKALRPT